MCHPAPTTMGRVWRRRIEKEPPISRDEVLVIMGALADISAWTRDIHAFLLEDDDEEETKADS